MSLDIVDSWSSHKKTNQEHQATLTHAQRYSIIIKSFLSGVGSDVLRAILEEAAENTDCTLGQYLLHCQTNIIYSLQPQFRHHIVLVYPPDESEPDLLKWNCRLLCVVLSATHCLDTRGKDDVSFIERTYQKHVQDEKLQTKHSTLRPKQQPKPKREWIRTYATIQRLVENLRDTRLLASVRNFICKIEMGAKTMDARIETHISLTKMIAELAASHTDRLNEEDSSLRKQLGELAKIKQQYDAVSKPSFTSARSRKNLSRSMIIDGKETRPMSAKDNDIQDKPTRPKSALSGVSQSTTISRLSGLKPFKRGNSFDSVKTSGTSRRPMRPFSNTSRDRQPLRSVNLVTPKLSQTRKIQSKENTVSGDNCVAKADKSNTEKTLTPPNDRNYANILDNNIIISEDAYSDAVLHDKNTDLTTSTRQEHTNGNTNGITSLATASNQMNGRSISRPHSLDVVRPHSLDSRRPHSFDVFQRNRPVSTRTTDRNINRRISNISCDERPKSILKKRNDDIVLIYTQSLKLQPKHKDHQNHTDKTPPSPRMTKSIPQQTLFDKQNDAMVIISKPTYSSLLAYTRKYRPQIKKKESIADKPIIHETVMEEIKETVTVDEVIDSSESESDNTSLEDETPATPIQTKSTFGRFRDMLKKKLTSKKSDDNKEIDDNKEKPFDNPLLKGNNKENVLNENGVDKTFEKSGKTTVNSDEAQLDEIRGGNNDGTSRNDAIGQLQGMLMNILPPKVHQHAAPESTDNTSEVKVQSETNLDEVVSPTNFDLLTNNTGPSTEESKGTHEIKKNNRVRFFKEHDKVSNMPNTKHKLSEDRKRRQSLPTEVIRSQDTTFSSNPTRGIENLDNISQALLESPTNDRMTAMKQRRFSVAPTHDSSRSLPAKESNTYSTQSINRSNTTDLKANTIPINEDTMVTIDEEKDVISSNAVNTMQTTISSTENTTISDDEKATKTINADPQTTIKTIPNILQATEKNTKEKNASISQRRKSIAMGSLKKLNRDKDKQSWCERSLSESEFNPEALKKAIMLTEIQTQHSVNLEKVKKTSDNKPDQSDQKSLLNSSVIFEEEECNSKTNPTQNEDKSDKANENEKHAPTAPSTRRKSIANGSLRLNGDKPKTLILERSRSEDEIKVGAVTDLENVKKTEYDFNTNEKQAKVETKTELESKTSQSKNLSLIPNAVLYEEAENIKAGSQNTEQNGGQQKNKSQEIVTNNTSEKCQPNIEQKQHTVDISNTEESKTLAKNNTILLQNTDSTKTQASVAKQKKKTKLPKDRRKSGYKNNNKKGKHPELVRSKSETEFNMDALVEVNKQNDNQKSSKAEADKTKNVADKMIGKSNHNENATIFEEDEASFDETKTWLKDDKKETDTTASAQNEINATPESKQVKTIDSNGENIPELEDDPEAEMKRLANDVIVHHQVHKVAREFMEKDRTFVDEFFTFLHKYKATKEFLKTEQYSPFKTMKLPNGIKAALSFLHAFTFRHINVFERDVCHYVVEKILKRTECEDAKRAKKEEDEIISRIKAEVKSRKKTPFHHTKTITKETMVNLKKMKDTEKSAMKGNKLDDPGNKRPVSALKNIEMCKCWKCRHKDLAMTIAVNWRNHGICQLLMSYCVHFKLEHLLPAVRANDADNVKAIVAYLKGRFEWDPDNDDAKMALILARFHDMQDIVTYLEKEGVQDERVVQCTCFA